MTFIRAELMLFLKLCQAVCMTSQQTYEAIKIRRSLCGLYTVMYW